MGGGLDLDADAVSGDPGAGQDIKDVAAAPDDGTAADDSTTSVGETTAGEGTTAGEDAPFCTPDCSDRQCGDDGCGGDCGPCPTDLPFCSRGGLCLTDCQPDCLGKRCGEDGCGGQCGECPPWAAICGTDFLCTDACTPDCSERRCGSDGCGGSCGSCGTGELCKEGNCQPACESDPECEGEVGTSCANDRAEWRCEEVVPGCIQRLGPTVCAGEGLCLDGRCTELVCSPFSVGCEGEARVECDQSGLFTTVAEDCAAAGSTCRFGACIEPLSCEGSPCSVGEFCQRAADQSALSEEGMVDLVSQCASQCEADGPCLDRCLETDTMLSRPCIQCTTDYLLCGDETCDILCSLEFDELCGDCLAEAGCGASFEQCAGIAFPLDPLPVDYCAIAGWCENGSTCTLDEESGFTCHCVDGWVGLFCDERGACQDATDDEIPGIEPLNAAVSGCVSDCDGLIEAACIDGCLAEGLSSESECSNCVVEMLVCGVWWCREECTEGLSSACLTCHDEYECLAAFAACAGVDFPYLSAETSCGDGNCDADESTATCPGDCPEEGFVTIPAGTFMMGTADDAPIAGPGETPQRAVEIKRAFWQKTTEVTQGEWKSLMGADKNPSGYSACGDDCPVETITWWEALAYSNALSAAEGLPVCYTLSGCNDSEPGEGMVCTAAAVNAADGNPLLCDGYRLPTEAEWERAARAGTDTAWFNGEISYVQGDCGNDPVLEDIGWYCDNWGGSSHPVAQKLANPYGLYDTAGNVWEWAWDWRDDEYYGSRDEPDTDPLGGATGRGRAMRGGGAASDATGCRVSNRGHLPPHERADYLGLRPVRTIFAGHCYDGAQSDGETGVDCGGGCAPCPTCGDGGCQGEESPRTCPGDCAAEGFVTIPAGSFTMGSPEDENGRDDDEGPQREVTLSRDFWLNVTEVTQAEWRAVMGTDPAAFAGCGDDCPVERVSWWDALEYCNMRSQLEGLEECYSLSDCTGTLGGGCAEGEMNCEGGYACAGVTFQGPGCEGYRLPTEAEWEYAYRADTTTAFYNGPITNWGFNYDSDANLDLIAWFGGTSGGTPHPVGKKLANPWGLFDMSGNVNEWVWDRYAASYPAVAEIDPLGPSADSDRVLRGGTWGGRARHNRAASRVGWVPDGRDDSVGFRTARTVFPGHCYDGEHGEGETGVDCGGPCASCFVCGDGACGDGESVASCPADCFAVGFVEIPAGTFTMGSAPGRPGRNNDETQHEVTVSRAFMLKSTEVTQGEWKALMSEASNPSTRSDCGDDCPVETLTWWETLAWCNARSTADGFAPCYTLSGCDAAAPGEGMVCASVSVNAPQENPLLCSGFRLPTEAEWEYAARSGTQTAVYSGEVIEFEAGTLDPFLDAIAWYQENSGGSTHPVATKSPSPWNLYDMAGNVWEWTWDWKGDYPPGPVTDPVGPEAGTLRMSRGGAQDSPAKNCRAADRSADDPDGRYHDLGFRPARTIFD